MRTQRPILLTGAAGRLAAILRPSLLARYGALRSTDIASVAALPGEDVRRCDLGDAAAADDVVAGCRTIVHFGGAASSGGFTELLHANVVGTYNLFEAARRHRVARIVFASSGHVVGFHLKNGQIDADAPHRPDSLYGLSKCFGEDLARLYWDKHGIECAAVRIGMCGFGPPSGPFAPIWLSDADLCRLVEACLDAPLIGFTVIYGSSNNRDLPWHNARATHIPFTLIDRNYDPQTAHTQSAHQMSGDPASLFIGGAICAAGYIPPNEK